MGDFVYEKYKKECGGRGFNLYAVHVPVDNVLSGNGLWF
jgi:hypothetical protein